MTLHPIVAQIDPNDAQRPAVLARDRDVVVTAGAGTGKTRTLVARYLSLLADDVPLRSIVAITFTRKAAREMRNRVRAEMRRYLQRAELTPDEQQRWSERYSELDAARIGTIHALCTEILRAQPAEASLDPRFEVLDEGQAAILRAQALDQTLAWAADQTQVVILFELLGELGLRQLLSELLSRRLEVASLFSTLPADPWPLWEAALVEPLQAFVDDPAVQAGFVELTALATDGTLDRAAARRDALVEPLREVMARWQAIMAARGADEWETISGHLGPLRANLKQKGSQKNWQPAMPKDTIAELQTVFDEIVPSWLKGGDLGLDHRWAEAWPAVRLASARLIAIYQTLKEERQALDFDDLEWRALQLLQQHPTVRQRWQAEIQALLVDEYQDTNHRQRDLVNVLNDDRGKLFIVGDAKQSIYRFRGADVTVFRHERQRIAADSGVGFALATSYRAHRRLVEGLNALLRPVLGEGEDPERPFREPFAPLDHDRVEPRFGLEEPFIELHLALGSKSDGALAHAARGLADRLMALVAADAELTYGDIAILCRASGSFAAYENALDAAGIPYVTVAGRGFFDRPEIRDLLNALRALADPTDDLALVGLLRSPVFGFTDMELYQVAQARALSSSQTVWEALQQYNVEKASRAKAIIGDLHGRSGRLPVADVLKDFLDETDYRAALVQAGQARAARNVDKLLVDAHTSGLVALDQFLEYVTQLRAAAPREGEARATTGEAVRIMSVHAAKGLEFPIVVVGDAGYDRHARPNLILDDRLGLAVPLSDEAGATSVLYQRLLQQESEAEAAEADRLLYVAATRAEELLIFSGVLRLTGSQKPGWLSGWLKQIAGPIGLADTTIPYDEEGERALALDLHIEQTPVRALVYEPGYQAGQTAVAAEAPVSAGAFTAALLTPLPDLPAGDRALTVRREEEQPWDVLPSTEQPGAPAVTVGHLVHLALEHWRFGGPGFNTWLEGHARSRGLIHAGQVDDALLRARRLLERFTDTPLFAEIEAAPQRFHEIAVEIPALDNNVLPAGRTSRHRVIDLLYQHQGRWKLIDFKTDEVTQEAEIDKWDQYQYQLTEYRHAIRYLLGEAPEALLCFLDYEGEVRLFPSQ
ncbi:MAG: UvrD-helicase domain-containing protein [Candidatus Promineifilaceae bacterium]|nr:UvrD-helicase domain-containing protein [Candidatus Promineifilaceae bacterium]